MGLEIAPALAALGLDITDTRAWGTIAAGIFGLILVIYLAIDYSRYARFSNLPGPAAWPIVGHIPYLLKEPWIRFANFSEQFGRIYRLKVWDRCFVVVSKPSAVKQLFQTHKDKYIKDPWSYQFFQDVLGHGLVTSEGDQWKRKRKLLAPAFHFAALSRLQPLFDEASLRLVAKLRRACASKATAAASNIQFDANHGTLTRSDVTLEPRGDGTAIFEVSSVFRLLTLEVISQLAVGLKPEDASVFPTIFEAVVDELNKRVMQPWRPLWCPNEIAHRRRLNKLQTIVLELIANRRAQLAARGGPASTKQAFDDSLAMNGNTNGASLTGVPIFANGKDMLDMMLESGVELSDEELADELRTQLLAGHETSSMLLTWATYLLCKHPEDLKKVVDELDRVVGLAPGVTQSRVAGARTVEAPTFEDFRNLDYMDCVLKEAMRVYTPVPVLNKLSVEEDELEGFHIPAQTPIIVSVWALHTDPEIWGKDANKFRPSRFERAETANIEDFNYAYIPFAVGPRSCIGQPLAMTEAKVVIGHLLRHYDIKLAPGQPDATTDCYVIPCRPAERIHIVATPRK